MASPSDRDLEILRLANALYRYEANRLQDARERFNLSANQFWITVARLIGDEAVVRAAPELALPLIRQREQRGRLKRAG